MRRLFLTIGSLVLVFSRSVLADSLTDRQIEWLRANAISIETVEAERGFSDLARLKEVIGAARIVSLGESTHGSREIFQMKHRLVEFLASELGFTIFSIEANMPEAYRLNDYVRSGEGDPNRLIAGMYFWTWNTEEVKEMVQWMRRFNQAGRRMDFTGFDMQTPDVAMQEVMQFLKKSDEQQFEAAQPAYADAAKPQQVARREFGIATGSFPIEAARGKKLSFSGWIKVEKLDGYAGLWFRADGPNQKTLAFDNMQRQLISGTRDWQRYSIELSVPAETVNINFGVLMPGTGKAWFDDLTITLDGQPFQNADVFDFDFESDQIKGLIAIPQRTYRTALDANIAKVGKQSLRLESIVPMRETVSPEQFRKTLAACEEVHSKLQKSREELLTKFAAKDIDWAIQNARIVVKALQQRGGDMRIRDAAMADNVEWILQQNPDAKIVLWAHNGHVNKRPFAMGKYLDQKFGKEHLAIGFATSKGDYQAIGNGKGLSNHKLQTAPDDSIEAAFQRTGLPRFFLDLRGIATSPDAAWLNEPHPFRSIGALAMEQQFSPASLSSMFDAIIYLEETSPAKPIR